MYIILSPQWISETNRYYEFIFKFFLQDVWKSDNSSLLFFFFIGTIFEASIQRKITVVNAMVYNTAKQFNHRLGKPLDDVVKHAIHVARFFIINTFNYVINFCRVGYMVSIRIWECIEAKNMIWNCIYTTSGSWIKIIHWPHRNCTAENWEIKVSAIICDFCWISFEIADDGTIEVTKKSLLNTFKGILGCI